MLEGAPFASRCTPSWPARSSALYGRPRPLRCVAKARERVDFFPDGLEDLEGVHFLQSSGTPVDYLRQFCHENGDLPTGEATPRGA